jgi:hypothetical protein
MGLLDKLENRKINAEDLAEEVMNNPKLLKQILKGVSSPIANIKFTSTKVLRIISKKAPKILYAKMDFFVKLLASENNIIKWNAMDIIANLVAVDTRNKFNKIFKKFYGLLNEGSLVTAAHVVDNSAKIVKAKSEFQNKITSALLKIEKIPLPTEECRNILRGKTIQAFSQYFAQIKNKSRIISFVKRQLNNRRNATKKRAKEFLKKFNRR